MWPTEPLVARADDLTSVRDALRSTGRCTVVGPGGIGKSALARSVAASVDLAVRWVDAEPLDSAADLAVAVVRACAGELHPDEDPEASAVAVLDGRADLLIIDGVEHLGDVEPLIARLPTSPDGPWVLVTTRRLGSPSPVHRLDPLDHGGADGGAAGQLLRSELVARGASPADHDIGPLAKRSGGLPLAIRLLAQRLAAGGSVATELADRDGSASAPSLDPVLAASVHRSLDLVSDAASACFAVLGLTGTAFTPPYVAVLAGDTVGAVSSALTELTRVGLVMSASGGHDLLPPIRDAAIHHLAERTGGAGLTTAVEGVLALTSTGWASGERAAIVGDNLDNLLHLAWIAVQSVHPAAQRLVDAVFVPLHDQMRNREYLRLASQALELPNSDALLEAGTALRAAIAASECVSISVASTYLDRAASAWERSGSPEGTGGRISSIRAAFAQDTGDLKAARRLAEQGVGLGQQAADDQFYVWQARHQLALISLKEGRLDEAEESATASVEWGRSQDRYIHDNGAIVLAWIALERGRTAEAAAQARHLRDDDMAPRHQVQAEFVLEAQAIELAAEPRFDGTVPEDRREHAGWLRLTLRLVQSAAAPIDENWEWVMRVAADVVVLADSFPLDYPRVMARNLLGDAALAGGELRQAQQSYELALREAVRSGYRLRAADALDGCAALAVALGDHHSANDATGLADAVRAWCGAHPWPRPSLPLRHIVASEATVDDGMPRLADVDHLVERLAQATADPVGSDPIWNRLTKSEREIAQRAATGASNNEIAAELYISRRTVESHLQRVYRKLDIRSRTQLATILAARERSTSRAGSSVSR